MNGSVLFIPGARRILGEVDALIQNLSSQTGEIEVSLGPVIGQCSPGNMQLIANFLLIEPLTR